MSNSLFTRSEKDQLRILELPVIDTPVTRATETWLTLQKGNCADLELDYARCAARAGMLREERDCKRFFEDMQECVFSKKSKARFEAIQVERKKQGLKPMAAPEPDSVFLWSK